MPDPTVTPGPETSPGLGGVNLSPQVLQMLAPDLRPSEAKVETDTSADEDEPTGDATGGEDAGKTGDGPADSTGTQAKPKPKHDAAEWARVISEVPQRIHEVPSGMVAETIKLMQDNLRRANEMAVENAANRARQEEAQEATIRAEIAKIDELRTSDPDGFSSWGAEHPDRLNAYLKLRDSHAEVPPEVARRVEAEINAEALQAVAVLDAFPAAREKLALLAQTAPYQSTPAGLRRLAVDVERLLREAEGPAQRAAAEREQAAARERSRPAAVVLDGPSPSSDGLPVGWKTMSYEALRRIPDWEKKTQAALAKEAR